MSFLKSLFSLARRRVTHFPAHMVCRLRYSQIQHEMNVDLFEISKKSCAVIVQGYTLKIGDEVEIQIGEKSNYLRGFVRSQKKYPSKNVKTLGLASYRYSIELIDELPSFRHVEQI